MKGRIKNAAGIIVLSFIIMIINGCENSRFLTTLSSPVDNNIQEEEVTILKYVYAGGDSISNQSMSEAIEAFNQSHVKIQIMGIPSLPGSVTYDEYLKTLTAVGEFPELLDMRDAQTYADAGKIAPIPQEIVDLFEDVAKVNGKVYTAPVVKEYLLGIIYNKDIFEQAGITKEPNTWQEFLEDCQKIKDLGISPIVVGGKDLWHMGFWQGFFMGNDMFAENENWNSDRKAGRVHFSDENVVKAMKDMTELWTKGYVDDNWLTTEDSQVSTILISGKAAMLYEGNWMLSTVKQADPNFNVGFFAPKDREGRAIMVGKPTPQGFALSAEAAKNPSKVVAFIEFMKFFYHKDNYAKYLQTNNAISATKEKVTYEVPEEMQKILATYNDPKTIKVQLMHQYWGENKISTEFRDWLWRLTQQWLIEEELSIEDAMKLADEEFDRVVHDGED
ncbi:ABC transporter substrate-binding protein [Paenibacillus sp. FA6]|uniref:ABC transporter substrate-binding protein n=1 Tax=Paenibacillus sp. FA6 TaxID=3413029 RepID=UPI003F657F18